MQCRFLELLCYVLCSSSLVAGPFSQLSRSEAFLLNPVDETLMVRLVCFPGSVLCSVVLENADDKERLLAFSSSLPNTFRLFVHANGGLFEHG